MDQLYFTNTFKAQFYAQFFSAAGSFLTAQNLIMLKSFFNI